MADGGYNKGASEEVVEFMQLVNDAESTNRAEGLRDLRFRYGDQWPTAMATARRGQGPVEDRPCLTINETDSYIRQMENQLRQQRPRIKASPVDSGADPKTAQVITGLCRHVEENSDASNAYDIATSFQITMGWGYWRLRTDYIREDSFDQDIYIDPVENPFTVSFDPNSSEPDGSDAEKVAITDMMRLDAFRREFPGAQESGVVETSIGDATADWVREHDIRLAEYFRVEREKADLVMLSNGKTAYKGDPMLTPSFLAAQELTVVGSRPSYKRKVTWCKVSAFETLEEKTLPGRWIPVVPVYGMTVFIDGRRQKFGAVRFARDPQMMVNFWQTAITESIAMGPKPKWLMADGQDEGHENEWANANNSPYPVLRHKQKDSEGNPAPPPSRIQPEPPPEGMIMATMQASQNLQRVLGIYDPGVRSGSHKSDKTINAESQQSEMTNYHFYDNFTRSLKHTGRIILDWTPPVFDRQRVQRIIGEDGKEKLVTLNEKKSGMNAMGQAIETVLNDVTVGTFDVIMDVGPGYNSKRQESAALLMQLLDTPLGEKVAAVADDVIMRTFDFNGADVVADRLAAANPLSQIDEESDVPPQAQMMIKGLQDQVQKMGQALQQAGIEIKFGLQKEQIRQDGETKRTLMKETGNAHNVEQTANFKQHDTETRAVTAQNVAEIDGLVKLLIAHLDTAKLEKQIAAKDREQQAKADQEEPVAQ